jgi:hypothetical protein
VATTPKTGAPASSNIGLVGTSRRTRAKAVYRVVSLDETATRLLEEVAPRWIVDDVDLPGSGAFRIALAGLVVGHGFHERLSSDPHTVVSRADLETWVAALSLAKWGKELYNAAGRYMFLRPNPTRADLRGPRAAGPWYNHPLERPRLFVADCLIDPVVRRALSASEQRRFRLDEILGRVPADRAGFVAAVLRYASSFIAGELGPDFLPAEFYCPALPSFRERRLPTAKELFANEMEEFVP